MLQVSADGIDVVRRERFQRERAVGGASLLAAVAERQAAVWRRDQRVIASRGVAGVARSEVVLRVGSHARAARFASTLRQHGNRSVFVAISDDLQRPFHSASLR